MTTPRHPRIFDDVDTTAEEQALHDRTGIIERDERGQARWVVHAPSNAERTFDLLKALDKDGLAIEGEEPAPEPTPTSTPSPQSGYNPYDTGPAKAPTKRR